MDKATLSNTPRARPIDFVARMREVDGTVDPQRLGDWLRSRGLLKEIEELAGIEIARPKIKVTQENLSQRFVRTPHGYVRVPWDVRYELGQNQLFFGRRWPARTAADRECARCRMSDNRCGTALIRWRPRALSRMRAALGFRLEYWPQLRRVRAPVPYGDRRRSWSRSLGRSDSTRRNAVRAMLVGG